MRDLYEVLELERGASPGDVKRAYRRMAHRYHPDKNPGDQRAEEAFKEATAAYEVLSDPAKRRRYDRFGHAGVGMGGAGFDPFGFGGSGGGFAQGVGDVFSEIFSDFFGGKKGGRAKERGRDRRQRLTIDFETAALGGEEMIEIERHEGCKTCAGTGAKPGTSPQLCHACGGSGEIRVQQGLFSVSKRCTYCKARGRIIRDPCKKCGGKGRHTRQADLKVKIPAGADDTTTLRYAGQGELGAGGGDAGDLLVTFEVEGHPVFTRLGADIHLDLPITIVEATLGAQVEVPTLAGAVRMKIPAGTQTGRVFRLRNKGVANLSGSGQGDQHVTVTVETPMGLNGGEKALVEELGKVDDKRYSQRAALWKKLGRKS